MASSEHSTITTTLRGFSSCEGEDAVSVEHKGDSDHLNHRYKVTFYANGSCPENEGHVSIIFDSIEFNIKSNNDAVTFSCTASVIDAFGNKRFPQSVVIDQDIHSKDYVLFRRVAVGYSMKGFGFEKYLKRSTLLSDPSELLPDDCLTLCLEIDFVKAKYFSGTQYDTDGLLHDKNDNCYLRTDTEFARDLCEMSNVLHDMMEFSKDDGEPEWIPISYEEFISFKLIYFVLSEVDLHVTIKHTCKLYELADKYDMQKILQLCRELWISLLHVINTPKMLFVDSEMHLISELAEIFRDECLQKILSIYSVIKKKLEGGSDELDVSNVCELETEWRCRQLKGYVFEFSKKSRSCGMDGFK